MIADHLNRTFKKLRISLTHECNYACIYCSANNPNTVTAPQNILTNIQLPPKPLKTEYLLEITEQLHNQLNLNSVRLTGGEPMLHPRINYIVERVKYLGITNIGMTTNGHLFFKKANELKKAGLTSVNISLDALTPQTFKAMSRNSGLNNVLESIQTAIDLNLEVKLNSVIVAGKNEHEILPLLEFAIQKGIVIRFLELMSMGPLHKNKDSLFFSEKDILNSIKQKYVFTRMVRDNSATANYWAIDGRKTFGIIANDSSPFCSDCNRLRLDPYGNIYGCLSSLIPIQVSGLSETNLSKALQSALTHKQLSHFEGNTRTMQSIGG